MKPADKKSGIALNALAGLLIIAAACLHALLVSATLARAVFISQLWIFLPELALLGAAFYILDMARGVKRGLKDVLTLPETAWLAAAFAALLALYMFDYNSWKYSQIGDEWQFLEFVRDFIFTGYKLSLFGENGVYGLPVAASLYQASLMKVFGLFLGWKLSSALIAPLCLLPLYAWVKSLFGRNTAIITAAAFGFSIPMLGMGHTGYVNVQDVIFFVLPLFFLEIAMRKNSSFYSFLTALSLGMAFYTFHPARLMIVICPLYFFMHPERKNLSLLNIAVIAAVSAAIISLLVLDPAFIPNMISRTFAQPDDGNPNFVTAGQKPPYILINFLMTFFVFAYNNDVSKYIYGGLAGIAGSAGCAIGLGMIITGLKKDWRLRFLGATMVLFAVFLGALSPYWYPPNSRTHFMAPLLSVLTALGATLLIENFAEEKNRLRASLIAAAIIAVSNIFSFYLLMPARFTFSDYSFLVRAMQEAPRDSKLCLVLPTYTTFDRMQLRNYYGFSKRLSGTTGIGNSFREHSFMDKVCIISPDALANRQDMMALAGKTIKNNFGKTVACVYDFRGNNGLYAAVESEWESTPGN